MAAPDTTVASTVHKSTSTQPEKQPSTSAPTTQAQLSDAELNEAWAVQAITDSDAMTAAMGGVADAAGTYDLAATQAACVTLKSAAHTFGAHAPDSEAGRHARNAATMFEAAAQACIGGDLEGAASLMGAAGPEMDAATAAI